MDASEGQTEHDDALAPDEERFVEVFVDYWIRRGSQLMRSEVRAEEPGPPHKPQARVDR